jgi:hypothetical protein
MDRANQPGRSGAFASPSAADTVGQGHSRRLVVKVDAPCTAGGTQTVCRKRHQPAVKKAAAKPNSTKQ